VSGPRTTVLGKGRRSCWLVPNLGVFNSLGARPFCCAGVNSRASQTMATAGSCYLPLCLPQQVVRSLFSWRVRQPPSEWSFHRGLSFFLAQILLLSERNLCRGVARAQNGGPANAVALVVWYAVMCAPRLFRSRAHVLLREIEIFNIGLALPRFKRAPFLKGVPRLFPGPPFPFSRNAFHIGRRVLCHSFVRPVLHNLGMCKSVHVVFRPCVI